MIEQGSTNTSSPPKRKPTISEQLAAKAKAVTEPTPPPSPLDARISVFSRANRKTPDDTITMREFIKQAQDGTNAVAVGKVRSAVARGRADGLSPDEIKKRVGHVKMAELAAVTLSGSITAGERGKAFEDGRFTHSGWLQIDLDAQDLNGADEEATRDRIGKDSHIVAAMLSPTGEGVKAIMRIPVCRTPAEHKAAFLAAEKYMLATYGLKIDPATKDPARVCFVTHDPATTWNGAVIPLPVTEDAQPEPLAAPPAPATRTRQTSARAATASRENGIVIHGGTAGEDITLEDLAAMLKPIPRPGHDDWVKICGGAWNHFGEAATPILSAWMPEVSPGEYEYKFAHRMQDITIGTVIHTAQIHGYRPPVRARAVSLRVTPEQAAIVDKAVTGGDFLRAMEDEDRGLAQAYADIRFSSRCFSHDENSWRFYTGGIWTLDRTGGTLDDLQAVLTPLLVESANEVIRKLDPKENRGRIEYLRKRARCLFKLRTARAVLENAQVLREFRSNRGDFDKAPHLLAIENGVIDFDAVTVREHNPGDMLTVAAPLHYERGATCPHFDGFLDDVTCGDAELARFLLELTAYAMTGFTHIDMLAFFYGGGSNGKSTFIQTVERLLGPGLFRTLDNGILIGNRETNSDDYKRASLEGARLAVVDEIPDGKKLRTEELKKLTGGDSIQARNPYERPRTFQPSHKIWLAGNHKPEITTMDHGTWRRIILIPWNAKFSGEGASRDERIADHLAERAGILNRLLSAWQELKTRGGFAIPAAVRDASAAYQSDSDQVRMFAEDCLKKCSGMDILLAHVFDNFRKWCDANGEHSTAKTSAKFASELRRIGFSVRQKTGNKTFVEDVILPNPRELTS